MLKLPNWFSTSKKADLSSAEVALKVQTAVDAHAAAQARVEEAQVTLAAERSAPALEALRAAKDDAENVALMLAILREDQQAAIDRERERHLATVRKRRDEARAERSELVEREAGITAAAALALVEGWCTKQVERAEACQTIRTLDHQVRTLSRELGEIEPDFAVASEPSTFALAGALAALGPDLPSRAHALLERLVHVVEPAFQRIAAMEHSLATRAALGEESRVASLANPTPRLDLVRLDREAEPPAPAEERPMIRQMRAHLSGKAGDAA